MSRRKRDVDRKRKQLLYSCFVFFFVAEARDSVVDSGRFCSVATLVLVPFLDVAVGAGRATFDSEIAFRFDNIHSRFWWRIETIAMRIYFLIPVQSSLLVFQPVNNVEWYCALPLSSVIQWQ